MSEKLTCQITFAPTGLTVRARPGTPLADVIAEAGLAVVQPCGGEGICGQCAVILLSGASEPTEADREHFTGDQLEHGYRLACQVQVNPGFTLIEIPHASQPAASADHQILTTSDKAHPACEPITPPGVAADAWGLAIDIGTTTLAIEAIQMATGSTTGVEARLNPQTRFGDDVLSRILFSGQSEESLALIQRVLLDTLNEMIRNLADTSGIGPEQFRKAVISGNTAMQQLCRGVPSIALGQVPFTPDTLDGITRTADEAGLDILPTADVYVMPVIGGFVGGDALSGILTTEMTTGDAPALLVDIGTNGEIAVAHDGTLFAASAAAGPAFEGARISRGMRAARGAIEKVHFGDGRCQVEIIGDGPAVGLCGSGLIDLAAELLRWGLMLPSGKLLAADEVPRDTPDDLAGRLIEHESHPAFILAHPSRTKNGRPLLVSQRDFRELQLATGAIRAGMTLLLQRAGLQASDLSALHIAGGFGNFIRRSNAQRIGLLPPELAREKMQYRGNTSLAGARTLLLDPDAAQQAAAIAKAAEHVDLSHDPDFHMVFAESMIFPKE